MNIFWSIFPKMLTILYLVDKDCKVLKMNQLDLITLETLCYVYMILIIVLYIMVLLYLQLLTSISELLKVVNSTGIFDQPELRGVWASSSTTLHQLSCDLINTTWAQKVQTNRLTGDRPTYKWPAVQHALNVVKHNQPSNQKHIWRNKSNWFI